MTQSTYVLYLKKPEDEQTIANEKPPTQDESQSTHPLNQTYTLGENGRIFPSASDDGFHLKDELSEKEFETEVKAAVAKVNEKTLERMLIEMRSKDRDRDRILRPIQMKVLLEKYKVPVDSIMAQLLDKFDDKTFKGNTNYENLIQYLLEKKVQADSENTEDDVNPRKKSSSKSQSRRRSSGNEARETKNEATGVRKK